MAKLTKTFWFRAGYSSDEKKINKGWGLGSLILIWLALLAGGTIALGGTVQVFFPTFFPWLKSVTLGPSNVGTPNIIIHPVRTKFSDQITNSGAKGDRLPTAKIAPPIQVTPLGAPPLAVPVKKTTRKPQKRRKRSDILIATPVALSAPELAYEDEVSFCWTLNPKFDPPREFLKCAAETNGR